MVEQVWPSEMDVTEKETQKYDEIYSVPGNKYSIHGCLSNVRTPGRSL